MNIFLTFCCMITLNLSYAQDSIVEQKQPFWHEIIEFPDVEPSYPGGHAAIMNWANRNIIFPKDAFGEYEEKSIQASFIVEKDGRISEVKVIGAEDCRKMEYIISRMSGWSPGLVNNKPVRTRSSFQIKFELN